MAADPTPIDVSFQFLIGRLGTGLRDSNGVEIYGFNSS